jgi:hypothetical protein
MIIIVCEVCAPSSRIIPFMFAPKLIAVDGEMFFATRIMSSSWLKK